MSTDSNAPATTQDPMDSFKMKQEARLYAALAGLTREQLETIVADFVFTAHGAFLEEDHEGDSDTLGGFYTIIQENGLRPEGNIYDEEEEEE